MLATLTVNNFIFYYILLFLITWFILSFNNINNIEFTMLFFAFIFYLLFLMSDKSKSSFNGSGSGSSSSSSSNSIPVEIMKKIKYSYSNIIVSMSNIVNIKDTIFNIPTQISDRILPEFDRLIDILPQTDYKGNAINFISLENGASGVFSNDLDSNVYLDLRSNYYLCDKMFRDMRYTNSNLYFSLFP